MIPVLNVTHAELATPWINWRGGGGVTTSEESSGPTTNRLGLTGCCCPNQLSQPVVRPDRLVVGPELSSEVVTPLPPSN